MKRVKRIVLFLIFILSILKMFDYLEHSKFTIKDKKLVELLIHKQAENINLKGIFNDLIGINISYKDLTLNNNKVKITKLENKNIDKIKPIIYLYNTHQQEEYASNQFNEYSIKPTVMMSSYIMEEVVNSNGFSSIVEERSINEVLKQNNLNYAGSYEASRYLMEDAKKVYPTLKYFIDIHRDSINHDQSFISINEKKYAKVLFIVGLENPNYQENLEFTKMLNSKIDELYPGLSRGIYKKSGAGVNGVYNQDNSRYTILIEIGGEESTIDEVMNSTLAFTSCFIEVIKHEG